MAENTHLLQTHRALRLPGRDAPRDHRAAPVGAGEGREPGAAARWLENGYRINVGITHQETIGIDTPEDMARAIEFMEKRG